MPIDQETIVEILVDGLMLGSVELDFKKVREEIKKQLKDVMTIRLER